MRETERKSVLRWGFPAPASPPLPAFISLMGLKKPGFWSRMTLFGLSQRSLSSPFPSPQLFSSALWEETGQCGKAFTAALIPNTSDAPQSFPKSLCPSEFVCVCAERTCLYRSPPPSLFKTKTLCVAFVTLIPILPTPGAQADELPRNTKF